MKSVEIKRTAEQRFELFNFHHDELLQAICNWAQSNIPSPLLLEGKSGVGRKYAIEATNHLMLDKHSVVAINAEILDQSMENIEGALANKFALSDQQNKLLKEIKQYIKDAQIQNDSSTTGFAIVAHLGLFVNGVELILDFFRNVDKDLFQIHPYDHITDLIRNICQKESLILHLDNGESSPHVTEALLRITKRHNVAAHANDQLKPCLLVINCSDAQSFSNNFSLSDFKSFRFQPIRLTDLQSILPTRNIYLPDDVLKVLIGYGDPKKLSISPEILETQLVRLQRNKLLIHADDCYKIREGVNNNEILQIIGRPLTDHYDDQIKSIEQTQLRELVKEYMELASLCGPHSIPQIPLLYGLGLDYYGNDDDRETGDLILDTVEELFSIDVPKLLIESQGEMKDFRNKPIFCYRFRHTILQGHITHDLNDRKSQLVEKMLGELPKLIPHYESSRNSLFWYFAQTLGGKAQSNWFESLYFHVLGDDNITAYQTLIRKHLNDGATTAHSVITHALKQTHYPAYIKYLKITVDACSYKITPTLKDAALINNVAKVFLEQGDYENALRYHQQSLTINQEIGDKSGEGTLLNNISQIYRARGDYETALKYLQQSLAIQQEIDDNYGEGTTLNNISQIYYARGDYETALKYLQQSLVIRQEVGDKTGEGTTLNNIAQIYNARTDYETALEYLQQSLAIQQKIGDKSGESATLNNIAINTHARGDYETALKYLQQSLVIKQEVGDKTGEGATLNNISQIYVARGDYETALKYLQQSMATQQEIGDVTGLCATNFNIGNIQWQNGQEKEAFKSWVKVYKVAKKTEYAQALQALTNKAEELDLPNGLESWEMYLND